MKQLINYNEPLPAKYEQQMPDGLTASEKYNWRRQKFGELRMSGVITIDSNGKWYLNDTENDMPERNEENQLQTKQIDETNESTSVLLSLEQSVKPKKENKSADTKDEVESVHNIPKVVISTLRAFFPSATNKADLISAAAYILSKGAFVASDRVMKLVQVYNADDQLVSIDERLVRLENATRRQTEMLQSIELCTCYNAFDRRYGSQEPRKKPGETEFREKGSLDMLERLRLQARDQLAQDRAERGRKIYNQIKDKND